MKSKEFLLVLGNGIAIDGCDISYYQDKVDFNKMYKAGIRFVIIRAGYGKSTIDKNFVTYINGAVKAGLAVGVYWFVYAKNDADVIANAKKCLEAIAPYRHLLKCGVWVDWEYDSDKYAGYLSNARRSHKVSLFLDTVEAEGYEVGIYSNQDYIRSGKFTKELICEYPLWFAKYSSTMGMYANKGLGGKPYMWQNTSKGNGKSYGVSSKYLDMNKGYFEIVETNKVEESVVDKVQKDNGAVKASDNPYPKPKRVLQYIPGRYMQRGDDVKHAQWHLWRFGLMLTNGVPDATKIDGLWGPDCDAAQKEAERRLKLPDDGILTLEELELFNSI